MSVAPAVVQSSSGARRPRSGVDTWATIFVAIGTVGAVAYALFRDLVVVPRRRPKLDLRFDQNGNDRVVIGTAGGADAAYVRLRVANGAGKDTADDVVVMVTEVRRMKDSAKEIGETKPIGRPLTWSGSNPPLTVASVHPGSERHVDLLHVDWPGRDETDIERKWSGTAPLQLDLTPKPAGGQDVLESGAYEISVEVRARNADAIRYAISVDWDGKWSGKAAMWDHLRIEPPGKFGDRFFAPSWSRRKLAGVARLIVPPWRALGSSGRSALMRMLPGRADSRSRPRG
jgi:hypothetical protein